MSTLYSSIGFGRLCRVAGALLLGIPGLGADEASDDSPALPARTENLPFASWDGMELFGRLVLPSSEAPRAIVLYVQTAEGGTVDMKRPLGGGHTFNYYDLYREKLPAMGVGFFSYEGRGVRMGDEPPRFEKIDRGLYDTSTLENKVRDILSAVEAVRGVKGMEDIPIVLMGASEGTLLAAEAAARVPDSVAGLVLYGILATNLRENFAYILTGGEFLRYRLLDTDGDGAISREEWERLIKVTDFSAADLDGDGLFTVEDVRVVTKPYLDAIAVGDFDILQNWAETRAAASVPADWFRDHFAHPEIWTFLSQLDIPVGCFQGELDRMTPVGAVRALETQAKAAGLERMEFHYFAELDHTLNIGQYFTQGTLPEGHQAIFDFINRIAPPR